MLQMRKNEHFQYEMFRIILYLGFAVRASIQFSFENPNSIKVAKSPEDPTTGIGFPLEKRQFNIQPG